MRNAVRTYVLRTSFEEKSVADQREDVEVEIDAELLKEAVQLEIDISEVVDRRLREEIANHASRAPSPEGGRER